MGNMFGTLGGQEILFILVIALIVFGPKKLPEIGKSIGRMMAEFRKASNDFRRTLEEEVEADKLRPGETPLATTPPLQPETGHERSIVADSPASTTPAPPPAPPEAAVSAAEPSAPVPPEAPTVGRPDARPIEPH